MNELIIKTLKPLNIDVRFMEYTGQNDEYIIFSTIEEKDAFYSDDVNSAEKHEIALNFWYSKGSSFAKIKEIKALMKNAGFTYVTGTDLKENKTNGRSMIFKYTDFLY